jgi:hypothetical protein
MTFTDWSPGQPDDAGGEDCMELRGAFQYHWNDLPCNVPHRFICETSWVSSSRILFILYDMRIYHLLISITYVFSEHTTAMSSESEGIYTGTLYETDKKMNLG